MGGRQDYCIECHEYRKIYGRNLCSKCYQRHSYYGTLDQFPRNNTKGGNQGVCSDCKKYANQLLIGRCRRCYSRYQNSLPHIKAKHAENERNRRQRLRDEYHKRDRARWIKRRPQQLERHKLYYQNNRDRLCELARQWRKTHPQLVASYSRSKRIRQKEADGDFTLEQWQAIVEFYCSDNRCLCCGEEFSGNDKRKRLTIDHVIPPGKPHNGTNGPDNLQPLCSSCNSAKGARHFTDYRPDGGAFARSLMLDESLDVATP